MKSTEQMAAYSEAVKSGLYAKRSGLVGKYDNVRLSWEDEITRHFIYPYLRELVLHSKSRGHRLRIMDLGCGSGDGYELLSGVRDHEASLTHNQVYLIKPEMLETYTGVDLSTDLLDQAASVHSTNSKMQFRQGDFTKGLPMEDGEEPYDLYFSSYGTWSHHNDDETAIELLAEIARRTKEYALVVCDWLGRYSYEWTDVWTQDVSENKNLDYVVSYIYEKEEREAKRDELQHLLLRLMSRGEANAIIEEAGRRAGCEIKPLKFFDRSVVTGRHMDTAEYNAHAQAMRNAVNSLHEVNLRTDLETLIFDYVPQKGYGPQNAFFNQLVCCWNAVVEYTQGLLNNYDEDTHQLDLSKVPEPAAFPNLLGDNLKRMRDVVHGSGWLQYGLPRENIIEPQLGFTLRKLVCELQQGMGCAHGFCGILEISKS